MQFYIIINISKGHFSLIVQIRVLTRTKGKEHGWMDWQTDRHPVFLCPPQHDAQGTIKIPKWLEFIRWVIITWMSSSCCLMISLYLLICFCNLSYSPLNLESLGWGVIFTVPLLGPGNKNIINVKTNK